MYSRMEVLICEQTVEPDQRKGLPDSDYFKIYLKTAREMYSVTFFYYCDILFQFNRAMTLPLYRADPVLIR